MVSEQAFFGRIHPDKGTARAIDIAQEAGLPLRIAGIVQDQAYFDRSVRPHVDGERVRFLGAIGPEQRADLLGGARALLHLIDFDEPFGFSVVEAMACGTRSSPAGDAGAKLDGGDVSFTDGA